MRLSFRDTGKQSLVLSGAPSCVVTFRVAKPEPPKSRCFSGAEAATGWVSSSLSCRELFKNLKIVMKTQNIRSRMLICEFLLNF